MACIASLNVSAAFGKKKAAPVKKTAPKKKSAPAKRGASSGARKGNIGPNRTLWNGWESKPEPPAYLDGTLPGDAGFDPFGLSKPVEYLQFDLDALNQSVAVNPSGNVIGKLKKVDNKPTERTIVVRFFSSNKPRDTLHFIAFVVNDGSRAAPSASARGAEASRTLSLVYARYPAPRSTRGGRTRGEGRVARLRIDPAAIDRGSDRSFFPASRERRTFSRSNRSVAGRPPDDSRRPAPHPRLTTPTHNAITQPFNEAFDIVRFRECELQHSRWAMLGLVGAVVAESETGISWVDAGKVLNEQPQYLGFDINVPVPTLVWIEVLTMGFAEVKRSSELDSNKRCYPGGYFDPLGAYRVYASKRLFIFLAPPRTYT